MALRWDGNARCRVGAMKGLRRKRVQPGPTSPFLRPIFAVSSGISCGPLDLPGVASGDPPPFTLFNLEGDMRTIAAMLSTVGLCLLLGLSTTGCGKKKDTKGP